MSEVSVAQAKTRLTQLLQQVESGATVQITRRGKPVAVLVSKKEYERMKPPRESLHDFVQQWRTTMQEKGLAFFDDHELEDLRDQSARVASEFDDHGRIE